MHKLLREMAEFVGREWARRWLEHLQRSSEEQGISDRRRREQGEHDGRAKRSPDGPENATN